MATKDYSNLNHPIVVLIRGLPGSGKSFITQALANAIGADFAVVLDPDTIDFNSKAYADHVKAATADGVDPKLLPYRFLRAQAYAGIANCKIVIWNQPFTDLEIFKKMTGRFETQAADHKVKLSILVVEVNIDQATSARRTYERKQAGGHGPSGDRLQKFFDDYKSFAGEGYLVIQVDGTADVSKSVAQITEAIDQLV
jgi:gluconate kinase